MRRPSPISRVLADQAAASRPRRHFVCGFVFAVGAIGGGQALAPASVCAQEAHLSTPAAPKALYIDVIEGEGELNDIRSRTTREPIVQVKDENHKPVAGALVIFAVQPGGGAQPVAAFSGLSQVTVRTNENGMATARGFQVTHPGAVRISVMAAVGAVTTEVIIHETNYAPGGHLRQTLSSHKALEGFVAEVAAFGAATSVVLVESQSSRTPATITAGTGTVSAIHSGGHSR